MKLYTFPATANGLKIELMLQALEVKVNHEVINLFKGEHYSESFTLINPNRQIPVLVDGNETITESNAILITLAQRHHSDLYPENEQIRAQILKWLFWQGHHWGANVGVYSHQRVVMPKMGKTSDEDKITALLPEFHQSMETLNTHLGQMSFLAGEQVTIADICLSAYLMFYQESKVPLEQYLHVKTWLDVLSKIPWWQQTKIDALNFLKNTTN